MREKKNHWYVDGQDGSLLLYSFVAELIEN